MQSKCLQMVCQMAFDRLVGESAGCQLMVIPDDEGVVGEPVDALQPDTTDVPPAGSMVLLASR